MNRLGGDRRDTGPVRLNVAKVHVPLTAVLAAWAGRRAGRRARGGCSPPTGRRGRRPGRRSRSGSPRRTDRCSCCVGPVAFGATLVIWRHGRTRSRSPGYVVWRVRGVWRSASVYRWAWQPAMVTTGLAIRVDGTEYLPRIVVGRLDRVGGPGAGADAARPDPARLGHQRPTPGADLRRRRTAASAPSPGEVHELVLWFLTADPLTAPVPPFDPADPPALTGLPVALGEDGQVHRVRLLGAHLLVVGATGAGKGSVLWSLITALAAGIRDGLVQVWAIDPKGGMELAAGGPLFARFVYGDTPDGGDDDRVRAAVRPGPRGRRHRDAPPPVGAARPRPPAHPHHGRAADRGDHRRARLADRVRRSTGTPSGASPPPCRCCCPRAARSGSPWSGRCRTRARTSSRCATCSPPASCCASPNPNTSPSPSARGHATAAPRADLIDDATPGVAYVGQDGVPEAARVRFTHVTDDRHRRPRPAVRATGGAGAAGRGHGGGLMPTHGLPARWRPLGLEQWMRHGACLARTDLPWTADGHQTRSAERRTMAAVCAGCPVLTRMRGASPPAPDDGRLLGRRRRAMSRRRRARAS